MSNTMASQTEIDFSRGGDVEEVGSVRLNFGTFIGESKPSPRGDVEQLANLIDQWVDMPKYSMTAHLQHRVRSDEGMLKSVTRTFGDGKNTMTMYPARIADPKTGKEKDYFPTPTDEIIEFVLLKMLTDPDKGRFSKIDKSTRSGIVRFRLSDIERILKSHGVTRNRADIKHSLTVMARTHYEFKFGKGKVVEDRIISSLIVGDNDSYWTVRFPMIVSGAMEALTYRQFPFSTYLNLTKSASRWLLTRISMQKNFGEGYPHVFTLKEAQEQGVVNCKNMRDNTRQLKDAIQELCDQGVLDECDVNSHPITRIREGGKTTNIRFSLPANRFMLSQAMRANKRAKDMQVLKTPNRAIPASA